MPATTTNRGLAYPVGGDPIDTAGDMERLATSVDGLFAGWEMGTHPAVGLPGIWLASDETAAGYIFTVQGGLTVMNSAATGLSFRVGNTELLSINAGDGMNHKGPRFDAVNIIASGYIEAHQNMSCTLNLGVGGNANVTGIVYATGGVQANGLISTTVDVSAGRNVLAAGQINATGDLVTGVRLYGSSAGMAAAAGTWNEGQIVVTGNGSGGAGGVGVCRLGFGMNEGAWQLIHRGDNPSVAQFRTADQSSYIPVVASAFTNSLLVAAARDVVVTPGSTPTLDPRADTVPDVDVMALNPIAFRPAVEPTRAVVAAGYSEIDFADSASFTYEPIPAGDPAGFLDRRERLGLDPVAVQTVLPSAVARDADDVPVGIDYAQITVALLAHVQALTERIAVLEGAA